VKKDNAIKYIKYLHKMEQNQRKSLITLEIASLVEEIRLEFVAAYRQ